MKRDILYHGSSKKFKVLVPKNLHGDPDVGNAVFATPSREFALPYAGGKWGDRDINQNTQHKHGVRRVIVQEMRPGAFKDIFEGKKGYLYEVPKTTFKPAERGHTWEVISEKRVRPTRVEEIKDVGAALRRAGVQMLPYNYNDTLKVLRRREKRSAQMTPEKRRGYYEWWLEKAPPEVRPVLKEYLSKESAEVPTLLTVWGAIEKRAEVVTPLLPHQERVVQKIQEPDQPGLLVVHGLGSGKTLTSIAAQEALGMPTNVLVPASLRSNYLKEIEKHVKGRKRAKANVMSLQRAALKGEIEPADMMIVDEAHRLRDPSSKGYQVIKKTPTKKRLLLTGTPLFNRPYDIAPLTNLAAGAQVLPEDRKLFEQKFLKMEKVSPGLIGTLLGIKAGARTVLNPGSKKELQKVINKWIDYHGNRSEHFPSVEREDVRVPMTPKQRDYYNALMGTAPFWVRWKVKMGMPLNKGELSKLNAFLTGVRQVSNTTAPFTTGKPEQPKIDVALQRLKNHLAQTKRGGALIYSNFLAAGVNPMKRGLESAGIPYGEITGSMPKKKRDEMVKAYNAGALRTLIISSAGSEGLDLKGTRLIQMLDPHWNQEKLRQVEGRGIRYKSHEHLPPEERKVKVESYVATKPRRGLMEKFRVTSPGQGVDEFLKGMSAEKARLNAEVQSLFMNQPPFKPKVAPAPAPAPAPMPVQPPVQPPASPPPVIQPPTATPVAPMPTVKAVRPPAAG